MDEKVCQHIEAKIEYAVNTIIETARELIETGNFTYRTDSIKFYLPDDINSLLSSFLGPRIEAQVLPVLQEMFDMPVVFETNGFVLKLEGNKK